MAQEIQKPTDNKEFDFILKQDPEQSAAKKGVDKKVLAIVILVIATLLVMGISFIVGSNKKVQKSNSSSNATTQQQKASDVVESFFEYVEQGDAESAYALYSKNSPLSADDFKTLSIPFLQKLNLEQCKLVVNENGSLLNDAGRLIRTYSCPGKDFDGSVGLEFDMEDFEDGSFRIFYCNLVVVDES